MKDQDVKSLQYLRQSKITSFLLRGGSLDRKCSIFSNPHSQTKSVNSNGTIDNHENFSGSTFIRSPKTNTHPLAAFLSCRTASSTKISRKERIIDDKKNNVLQLKCITYNHALFGTDENSLKDLIGRLCAALASVSIEPSFSNQINSESIISSKTARGIAPNGIRFDKVGAALFAVGGASGIVRIFDFDEFLSVSQKTRNIFSKQKNKFVFHFF
jgi:hypothetical protein